MSINPREIPEGAIRYNTDSNKMEVWIGDKWMIVSTSSPTLDGGARGLFAGMTPDASTDVNTIEFITISTTGNSQNFGDLTQIRWGLASFASRSRGIFYTGHATPAAVNTIDFVTIASTGNATDLVMQQIVVQQIKLYLTKPEE